MRLRQPQLEGRQNNLRLTSEQVYWTADDGVERMLAEFPLPGATTGKPMYLVYLRYPADKKRIGVDPGHKDAACGFLIQMRNSNAGLTMIEHGKLTVKRGLSPSKGRHVIELGISCADDSKLIGRLIAQRNDWMMENFERFRRAGDVQALIATRGENVPDSQPTHLQQSLQPTEKQSTSEDQPESAGNQP